MQRKFNKNMIILSRTARVIKSAAVYSHERLDYNSRTVYTEFLFLRFIVIILRRRCFTS